MKTNQPYDFDKHLTNAHHHNYRLHYDKENVNDILFLFILLLLQLGIYFNDGMETIALQIC